jgi:hypothetical protein
VQVWPDWVHAKHGAAINWFTVTGEGSLAIVFTDASPVKTLLCGPNKAFCHAVIDKDAPSKPYRYGVRVVRAGKKGDVDPTVDVDPGMTAIVPPSFTTQ